MSIDSVSNRNSKKWGREMLMSSKSLLSRRSAEHTA